MRLNIHNWHSRTLPNPSLQILITCSHNKTSVLSHPLYDTVISISPFMTAFQSLETRILGYSQSYSVLNPEFLQLSYNAIWDVGHTLAQETVHWGLEDIKFVLNGKVDEVCINENTIGRAQGVVMSKEQTWGLFGSNYDIRYSSRTSTSSGPLLRMISSRFFSCYSYFCLFSLLNGHRCTVCGLDLRWFASLRRIC